MRNILPVLVRHMTAALNTVTKEFERGLAETDLRGVQLLYLFCVCQSPRLSQDGLAQQLGVDPSNVTRQLGALECRGYISRSRNPADGRQWLVEPTDKAYELLPRLVELMSDAQEALMRDMSHEEQELLCELTEHMGKNAARRAAKLAQHDKK